MSVPKVLLVVTCAFLVVPLLPVGPASADHGESVPVYKPSQGNYAAFDDAVRHYMADRDIHAATFAVSYKGDLLWEQGYGTMTRGGSDLVPPDALFRIASVVKPITAAAIEKLVAEERLAYDDYLYCATPKQARPCHLEITPPAGGVADERIFSVTVWHALKHTGGWDRSLSGDAMFKAIEIAESLGVPSPPSQEQIARYMLGQPLDRHPGFYYAYSNLGYMLLGLVIEKVTGQVFTAYVKDAVFVPDDIDQLLGRPVREDIHLGRTLAADRDPREPAYNCDGGWKGRNVFDPDEYVCWADGGWHLEAMEAHGGLVATASTVAWFLDHYTLSGKTRPLGTLPAPLLATGSNGWFFGSLDGTWSMARQRSDGYNMVVLFNQRYDDTHGFGYEDIRPVMDDALNDFKRRGGP